MEASTESALAAEISTFSFTLPLLTRERSGMNRRSGDRMKRRAVLRLAAATLVGSVLSAPLGSFAQKSAKTYRIGFLGTAFASGYVREVEWVRGGLRKLGYAEGGNLFVEYRWAEGNPERDRAHAAEFVKFKVDAIVVHNMIGALVAARETATIPIVMADGSDPVAAGVAVSLARPGRNVTGSTSFVPEESAKRLELLREAAPGIKRVAFLASSRPTPATATTREVLAAAASSMGIELQDFAMTDASDLPQAFDAMSTTRMDAVVVNNEPLLNSHAATISALAAAKRLPAAGYASFADAGGLLAYGANRPALYGRVGYFLDRVFRGEKPADIAFERAARFDLVVNRKTARALGILIPQSLLLRADRVIE